MVHPLQSVIVGSFIASEVPTYGGSLLLFCKRTRNLRQILLSATNCSLFQELTTTAILTFSEWRLTSRDPLPGLILLHMLCT